MDRRRPRRRRHRLWPELLHLDGRARPHRRVPLPAHLPTRRTADGREEVGPWDMSANNLVGRVEQDARPAARHGGPHILFDPPYAISLALEKSRDGRAMAFLQ